MTQDLEKRPKNFLKERILRYKPVVIIRKNIILFSILSIFLLTLLLGVWNIKRYEIYDLEGKDLPEVVHSQIEEYLKENIYDQNYFIFSPSTTRKDMYLGIARLESVRIEKVMPNKIVLFIEVYDSKYGAFLKNESCMILSSNGVVLETVCEEIGRECCEEYSVENSLIFFSSTDVEVSVFNEGKDRLLILEEVEKVVRVVEAFKYEVKNIKLENDILELVDQGDRVFRFTIADDINVQLKRFIVVVSRIKVEYMQIGTLDLRFERPVMLE